MNVWIAAAVALWFVGTCAYTTIRTLLAARDGSEYL